MIVRMAVEEDITQLVELRMQLFLETGEISSIEKATELRSATEQYFRQTMMPAQTRSWLAIIDDVVVAIGTLAEFSRPPYMGNLSGKEAYLLNMFTLPQYRRKGIAEKLLHQIAEFVQSNGYGKVWLHASQKGRSLYEKFGFLSNSVEMEWFPK